MFTYDNVKINLTWGKSYSKGSKISEWRKSLNMTQHTVKKRLLYGVWNTVEIIITPAKEEDLSYISMDISADSSLFSLQQDYRPNTD